MNTKMKRIEALMRKEKNHTDGDFLLLERELQEQLDEMSGENVTLKERVRKLNMIHTGLKNSKETGATHKIPGKGT